MNEPAAPRWTDPVGLPPPTIYEPADDAEPPFASATLPAVVLLLVGDVDRSWAARTAIALSDAWAAAGRRVVLADFHLENPVLQDELGGHGLEGVVDLFVYGASVARCTRSVEGHEFQFIPTGTYTPDAEALFRHPRWPKLVAGFQQSHATLLVFAPADAADLGALATWVDQALLLGDPREAAQITPLRLAGTDIRGLIVPPRGDTATASAIPAELPPVYHHEAPPAPPLSEEEEAALHLPPPPAREPHRGHRAAVLILWVLLGAALLTAIGYAIASVRPDLVPWASVESRTAEQTTPAPRALAREPAPLGEPLPFSVRVVAFQSFQAARERQLELRREIPGVLFFVTPEDVQGITYYKVMAGALPNVEVARETRDVLLASGALDPDEAAGDWSLIQEMRFSFMLADRPTRGAATAAVDSLLERQVPAYPVAVPYSDGVLHWYVYAGAFPDSLSATSLREQLTAAGLTPRLTVRFGSPASPEL